jgi:uncharacterized repeat protein (TIGR02543 family)
MEKILKNKFTRYSLVIVISLTMLFSCTLSAFADDGVAVDPASSAGTENVIPADEINELVEEGIAVPDEVILVMKENVDDEAIVEFNDEITGEISIGTDEKAVVISTSENLGEVIESYNDNPDVLYAQPNYIYYALEDTNDPSFSSQWALKTESETRVNQAWDILPEKQEDVRVAVIDSGLKNTTGSGSPIIPPDLVSNVNTDLMQDFSWGNAGSSDITDDTNESNGHGTHVAGIIAATANNSIGVAGVSYNRAEVIPYKVFKADGDDADTKDDCKTSGLVLAYAEAVKDGCKVINMSLGGYFNGNPLTKPVGDQILEAAINNAYAQGIITVAAAGNSNVSYFMFPSDYDNVISVTATTNTTGLNVRWTSSDHNEYKDIAAPGASIYSTIPSGYGNKTGTSMAAPYICGVIALLWSSYPSLTADQIKDLLYSTATDKGAPGRDEYYGYGLVNAEAALQEVNGWNDQEQTSYSVNFNSNGGSEVSSIIRLDGETLGYLPNTSKQGYDFDGWWTEVTGGTKILDSTTVSDDVTYYAHWIRLTYTATFDANEGAAQTTSISQLYGEVIGTLPTATRIGYTFDGWWTEAKGGDEVLDSTIVTENITYYAHWTRRSYTATFDANEGTAQTTSVLQLYGKAIGTLPTATRIGHAFDGWYTAASGGSKISPETPLLDHVTYYAHWNINKYTVNFNSRGGNAISAKTVPHTSAVGTLKSPKRSGYKFLGWYTKASGGSKITATKKVTANVTYYAHWVRVYTVKWNAKGGKVKVTSKTFTKSAKVGKLQTPKRSGYKFLGWYTKASGGSKISKNTKISKNKTYYAHWKK